MYPKTFSITLIITIVWICVFVHNLEAFSHHSTRSSSSSESSAYDAAPEPPQHNFHPPPPPPPLPPAPSTGSGLPPPGKVLHLNGKHHHHHTSLQDLANGYSSASHLSPPPSSFRPANLPPEQNGLLRLIIRSYLQNALAARGLSPMGVSSVGGGSGPPGGGGGMLEDIRAIPHQHREQIISQAMEHVANHPALKQRHLYVGSGPPPDYDPDRTLMALSENADPHTQYVGKLSPDGSKPKRMGGNGLNFLEEEDLLRDGMLKSKRNVGSHFPSEEICKTNRVWEQINKTQDFYNNDVEVIQEDDLQQFVYSYRCANHKGPCTGVSEMYESECTERWGWMYMYYRKLSDGEAQWGYVAAPHHCACRIHPKPSFLTGGQNGGGITPVPSTESPGRTLPNQSVPQLIRQIPVGGGGLGSIGGNQGGGQVGGGGAGSAGQSFTSSAAVAPPPISEELTRPEVGEEI